jgi:catechol 2,3-dioxygenase-like lactoylglutathione lyase family enzyme
MPGLSGARAAYFRHPEQTTLLELIEFAPHTGRFIRAAARHHDLGLFDVALRARNIDAIYADWKARGIEFISAPVVYTADWAKVTVKEVILIGPNRMPIALIERLSEPKPVISGRFGTLVDCAQFVSDWQGALAFYTEQLGYTNVFDRDLPDGLIDGVLDLPPGTQSRMAFLVMPPTATPAIELIRCTPPGASLAEVIRPENIGLFGLAFRVADLDQAIARSRGAGWPVVGGPLETENPVRGRIRAAVVSGPQRALIELFETR